MNFRDFERWLRQYGDAWKNGDPEGAGQLFSPDAAYFETPFTPALVGTAEIHRYWAEGAKNTQTNVSFGATVISFESETGFARWQATFRRVPTNTFVELDGVLLARFNHDMCCIEFREWWHRRES